MIFLDLLYDSLRTSTLEHDSFYQHKYKSKDFPITTPKGKYYSYVGEIYNQDNNPEMLKRDIEIFKNYKKHLHT